MPKAAQGRQRNLKRGLIEGTLGPAGPGSNLARTGSSMPADGRSAHWRRGLSPGLRVSALCTHNALSRRLHSATDSAVFGENVKFSLSTH